MEGISPFIFRWHRACAETPFICCFSKVQTHWFERISLGSRHEKHFYFCVSASKACPGVVTCDASVRAFLCREGKSLLLCEGLPQPPCSKARRCTKLCLHLPGALPGLSVRLDVGCLQTPLRCDA